MSDTLTQFLVRIRTYLREPDATKSWWSDANLIAFFNSNYWRRCAQIEMAHAGAFQISTSVNLVANTATYNWPSGFQKLIKVEILRSNGDTIPIMRQERHYGINPGNPSADQNTYNPNYRPVQGGITLEPVPVVSVTNGLIIHYLGLPTRLSSGSDTLHSDFPYIFDELLVLDTAITAYQQEGNLEDLQGLRRSLELMRAEFEVDWERYIENRIIAPSFVEPFAPHYSDA